MNADKIVEPYEIAEDKQEKQDHIREQIVFWKLRLAEAQKKHIQDLLVDVNNVDTWVSILEQDARKMGAYWREIKNLQQQLKGEN